MGLTVSGLVSGIDVDSLVEQLSEVERRPIQKLSLREADYQVRLTAYGNLKGFLEELRTSAMGLDSALDFKTFQASSSDEERFTATAATGAVQGTYNLTVHQLAQAHKIVSVGFDDTPVGPGTLQISAGPGLSTEISISATDTIDDVAEAINDAGAGINAIVISDGSHKFLSLSSDQTGENHRITVSVTNDADGSDTDTQGLSRLHYAPTYDAEGEPVSGTFNMSQSQKAQNAIISVDGVDNIVRDSNTIDDAIKGVTLTLYQAHEDPLNESSTLTVGRDTEAVVAKVGDFLEKYNQLLEFFDTVQRKPDAESQSTGVLFNDSTTKRIQKSLSDMLAGVIMADGSLDRLANLGVSLNEQNRLALTPSTLTEALNNNFEEVVDFFTLNPEEGSQGFAVQMVDRLDGMLKANTGLLSARQKGIQASIDDIQEKVIDIEARVEKMAARTRKQFESLELLLGQYQATADFLTQQLVGLDNLNNAISK
jgi:flagellar hook-associated protein 2